MTDYRYDRFDLEKALLPVWKSGVIYHETVMFMEGEEEARLMLPAAEIYEVRSPDLQTVYAEGKDYVLRDGNIVRCPGSRIPEMPLAEYYPDPASAPEGSCFEADVPGRQAIIYSEKPVFFSRQPGVTYRPAAPWTGPVPQKEPRLGRFVRKVFGGEPARAVYFGDSITTGRNSSSWMGCPPYAPAWYDMVTAKLRLLSGNSRIETVNTAENGEDSQWACRHIDDRVAPFEPDLLIYAFGMNDGAKSPEEFMDLTCRSLDRVQALCPECEVLLIATMLPHRRVKGFWGNQSLFYDVMLRRTAGRERIGLAPMTGIHEYMLRRKEYYHTTGNNVNHPNDFLSRIYAQAVLATLTDL
ncbi:MAG: SGNH/GDSL hydrolase family protein [Abditibacteriota bacterium]|nr:SGNH/GDSL hydrolase family protein [Abditibacteriota bacterium]